MNHYWKNRKESAISDSYGPYRLTVRYLENSNKAQVMMEDVSKYRFNLLWSHLMTDEQANAALELFRAVGYFDIPMMD